MISKTDKSMPNMNGPICKQNFILIKWLGSGAFGEVYQVYDKDLEKHSAVKISKQVQSQGLEKEIEVIRKLTEKNIPNTTKLYSDGHCPLLGDQRYYQMDLQDATLQDYIDMGNTLTPKELRDLMFELLFTLYKFRQHNFKHRDISTYNILYKINGEDRRYGLPNGNIKIVNSMIQPIYSDYNTSIFERSDPSELEDYSDILAVLQLWAELIEITPFLTDHDIGQIQAIIDQITDGDDLSPEFLGQIILLPYF